jgi:CsoR family transcriptional regulator, copper-sensing transcriptional repressor
MSQDLKKLAVVRLHRLQGQMRGLEKMVEKGAYCTDVLVQSAAVQKSLQGFNRAILENHLREHSIEHIRHNHQEQAIAELLRIYKLGNPAA